jgi:hypothetical protein
LPRRPEDVRAKLSLLDGVHAAKLKDGRSFERADPRWLPRQVYAGVMSLAVKVFSATKMRDREVLGERITEWLHELRPNIIGRIVTQSSDAEYHCLTITIVYER